MVVLYTIDCPKCLILEKKLNQKNISYTICKNTDIMKEKNIEKLPILQIEDKMLSYKQAVDWINNYGG